MSMPGTTSSGDASKKPGSFIIENRTFDELKVGDSVSLSRTLTKEDIELFAVMSGDVNPVHVDEAFARDDMFHKIIAHGMWGATLISTLLGTELPGPGTIYLSQTLTFRHPIGIGDTVVVSVTVRKKSAAKRNVILDCRVVNQGGKIVMEGVADVIAPEEKIARPRVRLPEVRLEEPGHRHRELIAKTEGRDPIRMAVVNPTDHLSLAGAVEAARAKLIVPILVGPPDAIQAAAKAGDIDISGYEIVSATDAEAAATRAVDLVLAGSADAIMKGALHTDVLMHAVVAGDHNLRTDRRVSHVFVMDVPTYPRPLLITDAAINIYPDLEAKRDIVQNAIELAQALGIERPKVAILSAVETVTPKIKSTLDAAALCKMADRGQITGGILDGPLAFDNAVSADAAKTKHIVSPVAGQADILLVPDLEAGNMLAKQLEYLADADGAGIVLGARVPIILTSRADKTLSRMASCAVALLFAHHRSQSRLSIK
ncbi:MAG: bifunctional enoyl-CoA hydratase/phosphate acetyltransferase [Methyloceanibacter sp.]